MKKMVVVFISLAALLLSSCASAQEFESEADERLYRSIEQGGDFQDVIESVIEGASIDKLKRGRLVNVNMVEFAVSNGRTDIAQWLILSGADVNYKTSIMGETLLMSMASAGEYDLCELLLEKGADISAKDRLSDTALEYAVKSGGDTSEAEIIRLMTLLIASGAELRRETLEAALSGYTGKGDGDCRYEIVRRITAALHGENTATRLRPALEAAIIGDGETAIRLINAGGVSLQDKRLILFYTSAFGSADTLAKLADKGFDLKSTDKDGNTLLIIAARYSNAETALYLLDRGTQDFYAKNRFGKTALDAAAESGSDTIVSLMDSKAPSTPAGAFGNTCDCPCRCG